MNDKWKVKELTWRANNYGAASAASGLEYRVWCDREEKWFYWNAVLDQRQMPIASTTPLKTLDEAKATAQADYESRIRSALEASPVAPKNEEIQRYIDRCKELSANGEYRWWSRLAEILSASPEPVQNGVTEEMVRAARAVLVRDGPARTAYIGTDTLRRALEAALSLPGRQAAAGDGEAAFASYHSFDGAGECYAPSEASLPQLDRKNNK